MSARERLGAALLSGLEGLGCPVFDAPPVRGAMPYVVVDEPVLVPRDAAGLRGFDARIAVQVFDAGERPERLRGLMGGVEDALCSLSGDLGEGWRLVAVSLTRSRIVRTGDRTWRGMSELVARLYRIDS